MGGERDFEQMWAEAQTRFERQTEKSLKYAGNRSLDMALVELNEHFHLRDLADDSKKARIKDLATNVLKFVQLLGGIATQGASTALQPASMCFNALSFLLDIPAKVSGFHDNIERLFKEVSGFLQQFQIYKRLDDYKQVGEELKEGAHKVMIALVDICGMSIKILRGSKRHTIKPMTKHVWLNDDSGIQAKLDEFRTLTTHQGRILDAITLEHVLKAEHDTSNSLSQVFALLDEEAERSRETLEKTQEISHDVKIMVKDTNEQKNEKKRTEEFATICKKLSVDESSIEQLERDFDQLKEKCLPYTGSWLSEIDAYKRWANLESESSSQLWLSGNDGSGKSSLAVSCLSTIKSRLDASANKPTRVSLAFYFFDRDEKKAQDNAVQDSLKCMAAKVARSNRIFHSKILAFLESKDAVLMGDASIEYLFRNLFCWTNAKGNSNTTYVLLFDGLDKLGHDDARQLLKVVSDFQTNELRVIMTGTDEVFESCQNSSGESIDSFPLIRVQDHNEPDIRNFLEQELKHQILPTDNPGALRIVKEIREELPGIANGNFRDVRQRIETIGSAITSSRSENEIKQLIHLDISEYKKDSNRKRLEELTSSLSIQEIEELNVILVWVLYGREWMLTEELAAALYLRTGRPLLQNLNIKIDRKYNTILRLDGKNRTDPLVKMKTPDLADFFEESFRERPLKNDAPGDNRPRISMTIQLHLVPIRQAQRFFWDLSEKVVLDEGKFVFTAANAHPGLLSRIGANKVDSCLLIVRSCFDLLLDEHKKETSALRPYAVRTIMDHLRELRNSMFDAIEVSERAELLENLFSLFHLSSLERYLDDDFFGVGRWLHGELYDIQEWLRDSEAAQKLRGKALRWLRQANASNVLYPLKEIAAMIACKWLSSRSPNAASPYYWISVFNLRLEDMKTPVKKETTGGVGSDKDTTHDPISKRFKNADIMKEKRTASARIERCAEWAVAAARINKNSLYYERLGNTYAFYSKMDLAIDNYLKAKELPDLSWQLHSALADAYAEKGRTDLALEEIEGTFAFLRSNDELSTSEKHDFVTCLVKAAEWHVELGQTSPAIDKLKESIKLDEHYYQSHYKLFRLLNDTEQGSAAKKVLTDMKDASAVQHESLSKLSSMLLEYPRWIAGSRPIEEILQVTRSNDIIQILLRGLEEALEFAVNNKMNFHEVGLHLCYGLALAHYSPDKSRQHFDIAVRHWEKSFRKGIKSEDLVTQFNAIYAAKLIFNHHFSRAQALMISRSKSKGHESHVARMTELKDEACLPRYNYRPLLVSLASFHALAENQEKARELLVDDVREGIRFLSYEDPANDHSGYNRLARALMYSGDDLNALSAWILYFLDRRSYKEAKAHGEGGGAGRKGAGPNALDPSGSQPEENPTGFVCDGVCKKRITFADSLWFCKVCDNVNFCNECLGQLQNRTLSRCVCSPDHQWLLVPAPAEELKLTGKGRVRVRGELKNGKREGGDIVTAEEWLEIIRENWRIPRVDKEEDKQVDEGEDDEGEEGDGEEGDGEEGDGEEGDGEEGDGEDGDGEDGDGEDGDGEDGKGEDGKGEDGESEKYESEEDESEEDESEDGEGGGGAGGVWST